MSLFAQLEALGTRRVLVASDRASGLRAFLVIDDTTLGPAAGGIRTRAYPDEAAALADAARLASAMTEKCALAGLPAGGGKAVVMDHPGLDREAAFPRLGEAIEELGGLFRTAGDLGTTPADLAALARRTRYVHTGEGSLLEAAGRGLLRCIEACAARLGATSVAELTVAIQGCGAIGGAAARALQTAGARLLVADVDGARARALAESTGARVVEAADVLSAPCDVLAPCALGGVIGTAEARGMRARALCGAANNALSDPGAAAELMERGILHVPDAIASAGAVIEGIGQMVLGLTDTSLLVDRLGIVAGEVLDEAATRRLPPSAVAAERARRIIAAGRRDALQ